MIYNIRVKKVEELTKNNTFSHKYLVILTFFKQLTIDNSFSVCQFRITEFVICYMKT